MLNQPIHSNDMETKISTILGGIIGTFAAYKANIFSAIMIAFLTGGAAWLGQQAAKQVQIYLKTKFKKKP